MCRKATSCVLLGDRPSDWSKRFPLQPPVWYDEQLLLFRKAVEQAINGQKDTAIQLLGKIRSDEMRYWFDEHGQMSGFHRAKKLGIPPPKVSPDSLDSVRSPARHERLVYERDSYTCRYCGLRLIAKRVLSAFENVVGISEFRTQGTNAEQHGVIHAFKIVADHVEHYKCGGRTHPDNLVAACPACNYGKYNYTLEQLGIDDPRERPPVEGNWDGLTSFIGGLNCNRMPPIA